MLLDVVEDVTEVLSTNVTALVLIEHLEVAVHRFAGFLHVLGKLVKNELLLPKVLHSILLKLTTELFVIDAI